MLRTPFIRSLIWLPMAEAIRDISDMFKPNLEPFFDPMQYHSHAHSQNHLQASFDKSSRHSKSNVLRNSQVDPTPLP